MSAAERLRAKHEAEAAHNPTVEEVVDEEDVAHPPPSLQAAANPEPAPSVVETSKPMSEKAAGKQKAKEEPEMPSRGLHVNGSPALNMHSEEAFPALGGGPKASTPASTPMAWGVKKPSLVHSGVNGSNGNASFSSLPSSRASTPSSGMGAPVSTNISTAAQPRNLPMPHMALPGRHTERIQFAPSQLQPKDKMKKPIQDVLRSINKSSKAKVEMKLGPNGVKIFEGTGPVDAARQALKDLAKEVGSTQHVSIPIPSSVRPHIIGRQGAIIQGISKRTGARIQVPKAEENVAPDMADDDSLTIDITIEGDAVAAEMARREIEAIVNERTSTVNMRLRDIPPEFFPFIAGPRNSKISALEDGRELKIHVPHYHTWSDRPPPQQPASGMPLFVPSQHSHILISGDRLAAQEARVQLERQVEELRRRITSAQIPIDRGRHQFVLDQGGASLHDLLEETGCAVVLPPASEDTEMLTITGPLDNIEMGMDKVMNLAMSMQMSGVDVTRDIARRHANSPMGPEAHARALTRYLQQRRAVEQLERQYDARIILPTSPDGASNWEIYSRDGTKGLRARSDIMNLIGAHPPSRLRHVDVDPFFHHHVHRRGADHVRNQFGVHLVGPEVSNESPHMILVYEGPGDADTYQIPKQQPSPQEIAQFERNLHQAEEHIFRLLQGQESIGAASVEVPPKYNDKVRKFVQREQSGLAEFEIPVQVTFGAPSKALSTSEGPVAVPTLGNECSLRGPSSTVEKLAGRIAAFVEQEKHDELERGHITSFDFPQKYTNHLIGKKGENINKYREEFDVEIQVRDGKVDITGPVAKAEAARAKIIALVKRMDDEATHVLKIKPQYHKDMIGVKGSQVIQLQNKYNVRVQFPRTTLPDDDRSIADDASEAGSGRNRRPHQGLDEVIVRGPKKGADEARDELLNLLQWTIDNSHTSTVSVAQAQLPSLIGQGGREMESIRLTTGAQIDVPSSRDGAGNNGRAEIQIKGTKKQVEEAKKLLEQRASVFDSTVTRTVDVNKDYHKALIGSGGANIRNIVLEAGGSDDRRDLARTVRFPRPESDENTIRVEGQKAIVDKIITAIESFARQRNNRITDIVEVMPEKHRMLIGRGGEVRRRLESQFNIGLDIPKLSEQGLSRSQIKVSGQPADVERAITHIKELVKDRVGETVQVPRKYHHAVSDNGQFFRRVRNDHKVTVDHGGHQLPQKPGSGTRSQVNGEESMPLITDDQDSIDNHHWEIIDDEENSEEGEIPWTMHGPPEGILQARALLERAIEQAKTKQSQSVGNLVLPDPKTYRFVIGQGGSQINYIRNETGCRITVPRDQAPGSAIEIVGNKEGVEHAKDLVLDAVLNGTHGRRRS
ncbi:hypothetical protein ACLMJK_007851 [Lecanora helva]